MLEFADLGRYEKIRWIMIGSEILGIYRYTVRVSGILGFPETELVDQSGPLGRTKG